MSAFTSTSSYGQPAPFAGQQLSNAPLAPSTSSVLGKKRDADDVDVGFEGESQQTLMAMSQESASTIPTSATAAAPAFKRRLTDATLQSSDMMDDGMNGSVDSSQQMHAFGAMHALPQGSLNLYAPGQQNAGFYSGTIPISPSAYSQQQQQQQQQAQDGFFAQKPEQRHLLRHLSIPNFPGSAAVSTSGTCSPAFSTFSTTDGTSLADSEMPFELDSPDHRDEDEGMMMDNYTYAQQQQQQQQQQPFYDSYNGQGWYDDDHMAGRYTGNNGDNYASKLENIMGHV